MRTFVIALLLAISYAQTELPYQSTYEDDLSDWSVQISNCENLGTIVGGYGTSDTIIWKNYSLPVINCSVRIQLGLLIFDNWKGEIAFLTVNGATLWSLAFSHASFTDALTLCDSSNEDIHDDELVYVDVSTTIERSSFVLAVNTTLNEHSLDASFGLHNIRITTDCPCDDTSLCEQHPSAKMEDSNSSETIGSFFKDNITLVIIIAVSFIALLYFCYWIYVANKAMCCTKRRNSTPDLVHINTVTSFTPSPRVVDLSLQKLSSASSSIEKRKHSIGV